jgi:nucleoid-associated protein YgaU
MANSYTVQPGDSLWKIAHEKGCDVKALFEANKDVEGIGGPPTYLIHYETKPFDAQGHGTPVVITIP